MKRFTDTAKWGDPWFMGLSLDTKLAFWYITENCDVAGVWDPNKRLANFCFMRDLDWDVIERELGERVKVLPCGKWQLVKFIPFQYGTLSAECIPHRNIFALIEKHGIDYPSPRVGLGYVKGKPTLKTRKEKKRQDKKGESEGEWMASLSADPANQGIDVPKEADKARFWCKQNRREFTKRFFVNWLLKADRALGSGYQAHTPIPGLPEPHNWKRWLNEKLPDSPLATGGATEAHDWSAIHRATQSSIISRMKEEPLED